MFCRKCGKTLLDGDRFCSYCGAQVIERSETKDTAGSLEEVIYNHDGNEKKPTAENEVYVKDVSEDDSVPKMNITQTWQEITDNTAEKHPVTPWNLDGFPLPGSEPKKTEEIKVDWEKRELLRFETMTNDSTDMVVNEAEANEPEEIKIADKATLKAAAKAEEKREVKTDIFDIFDRQMKAEEAEINSKNTLIFQREETESGAAKEDVCKGQGTTVNSLHTFEEDEIDKFYTFSKKNEEFQKLLDKEYERLKCEPQFTPGEGKVPSNIANLEIKIPEAAEVSVSLKSTNESDKVELSEVNKTDPQMENELKPTLETEPVKAIKTEPLSENKLDKESEPVNGLELVNEAELEIAPEPVSEVKQENEPVPTKKSESANEPAPKRDMESAALPWDETERFVGEFTDDEKGKKISPLAIVLGIIIVLLVFEVAVLGIKCFFPESSAAAFVNKNLGATTDWIDSLKTKSEEKKSDAEKKEASKTSEAAIQASKKETIADVPEPDPLPNPNKASLVAEALPYNINIKTVASDETLAYDPNKSYADKNINNSKTIENNIWYKDEHGNPTFYDSEIVKTIIQFDSAWIDYVNKKDGAIFALIKEQSPAYKSYKAFSKIGMIKESFEVLKIGEIRQSEKGFYVWVYEEIAITEKSKVKTATYNYVYYMEPVDKQLKIVSCEQV